MMYPNINEENVPMFEHNCSNAITGATSWLQFESLVRLTLSYNPVGGKIANTDS
jgi:hypothetical protein